MIIKTSYLISTVLLIFLASPRIAAQEDLYELKIGHPRIMMTKYDELALRFVLMENSLAEKIMNELRKDANELLKVKSVKYELDQHNSILEISREYVRRIVTLSLAYRIFEEDVYSDKAIEQMMHVCSFPSWNPQHFLDVAEMTAALAIGYDWNFYHLDGGQKETIRNSIVEKGLYPGLDVYQNAAGKPHVWYEMKNSWNQICAGGLVLGALAVGEDFPDLKNNILYQSIKNLIPTLDLYKPDGIWYEGPDYWGHANVYLAMLMSSLKSALEHDFGLSERPGISKTAESFVNSVSPTDGLFNFGDASNSKRSLNPALSWFGKSFGLPAVSAYYQQLIETNVTPGGLDYGKGRGRLFYLNLPWFDDGFIDGSSPPRAQHFRGLVELLVLHGSGDGSDALYVAAKGGKGTLDHQHLDIGSFVIEADGERWGIDLGAENDFLPGIDDKKVGGKRWKYYRNINKSHSTLVIGDDIQNPTGQAKFSKFKNQGNQPHGILDMSTAYVQAGSTIRGFKLLNDEQIVIRDEIRFNTNPTTVRWGMMTDARVQLQGEQVVLSKNGKTFYLKAFSDQPVTFQVEDARAYHPQARDNSGRRLIYLMLNEKSNQQLVEVSVVLGKHLNNLNESIVKGKLDSW